MTKKNKNDEKKTNKKTKDAKLANVEVANAAPEREEIATLSPQESKQLEPKDNVVVDKNVYSTTEPTTTEPSTDNPSTDNPSAPLDNVIFTVIASNQNICKSYQIQDNTVKKTKAVNVADCLSQTISIPFSNFSSFLDNITTKQSLVFGVHKNINVDAFFSDKLGVIHKQNLTTKDKDLILSRRVVNFKFLENQQGILYLDVDQSTEPKEIIAEIKKAIPDIDNIGYVLKQSSGCISSDNPEIKIPDEMNKTTGYHLYINVEDASKIPEHGDKIFQKLAFYEKFFL